MSSRRQLGSTVVAITRALTCALTLGLFAACDREPVDVPAGTESEARSSEPELPSANQDPTGDDHAGHDHAGHDHAQVGDPVDSDEPSKDTTSVFGQAELEQLVGEILAIAPENPTYRYPLEINMVERDQPKGAMLNACAGFEERDGVRQAVLFMFRGLVDAAQADQRILRAVLAHEIAHIVLGHQEEFVPFHDLFHHHTRQEERAADLLGAKFLEELGHDRQDMVDMLRLLDRCSRDKRVPYTAGVVGDHASAVTRASYLVPDDQLLQAVSQYEVGQMFMECRRFAEALRWFDNALVLQPTLHEANLNAALAALQDYYDRLPAAVHDAWLRPVFGPQLTDVRAMAGRAIKVTPEDEARYAAAVERIEQLPLMHYDSMRRFLAATADVLHPTADAETLARGVANLGALQKLAAEDGWRFEQIAQALANNHALGVARQGDAARAARLLIDAQQADKHFLPALSENFARVPLDGLDKDAALLALNSMSHLIKMSPRQAPAALEARDAIERECKRRKWTFKAPEQPLKLARCQVVSMRIEGTEVALFDKFTALNQQFGKYRFADKVDPDFDSLYWAWWGDREVHAAVENNRLVKLTSYRPDTALTLLPARRGSGEPQEVRVGMTEAEFHAVIGLSGTDEELKAFSPTLLDTAAAKRIQGEQTDEEPGTWRYYPTMNFGVLLKDGAVVAITVTPVKTQ